MFPSVIPLPNPIYGPCVRSSSFGDIFSHIGDIQSLLVIQAVKQATCSLTGPGIRLGLRGIRPGRVFIHSSTQ